MVAWEIGRSSNARSVTRWGGWDKIEAANFPIKNGATFKWGGTKEFWDTDFLQSEKFRDEVRPAKFVDQRQKTAFPVD